MTDLVKDKLYHSLVVKNVLFELSLLRVLSNRKLKII